MAGNSPFIERNSSQRSVCRPSPAVGRNMSTTLESEVEVIEMGNLPDETNANTQTQTQNNETAAEACSIDMTQTSSDKTLTLCSRHDYEEVMLDDVGGKEGQGFHGAAATGDHVYDDPDETEPGINLTEAQGYEEPITRCWKRLSLPTLDNPSIAALALSSRMQRRNSSASELHTSGNDFKPQAAMAPSAILESSNFKPQAKKGRILHYAEFSLYPNKEAKALSSATEAAPSTPSAHKPLSSRPSKEPHQYEEPSFPAGGNVRQPPHSIPAPRRLLRRNTVNDYEIPVVTSPPCFRPKSSQSMMQQVRQKLHHLSTGKIHGGNLNDENVRLIEAESDDMSDMLKSPGNEAFSSSQDSNSSSNVSVVYRCWLSFARGVILGEGGGGGGGRGRGRRGGVGGLGSMPWEVCVVVGSLL